MGDKVAIVEGDIVGLANAAAKDMAFRQMIDRVRKQDLAEHGFKRKTGFVGDKLQSEDGKLYEVAMDGSYRRLTPKPISKKRRRRNDKQL